MFKQVAITLGAFALLGLFVVGCSDDEKTTDSRPPAANTQIELIDIGALIEAAVPPEFTAPALTPGGTDSLGSWTGGEHPLLQNVFGSVEPEALYSNINSFKNSYDIITSTMEVDADGNIVTGTYVDSAFSNSPDGEMMIHFTVVVTALTDSTVMPAEAQEVIGAAFDIDYLLNVSLEEWPDATILIGMTLTDSEQTLIQYDAGMDKPGNTASRLIYGSLNPIDSTFVFKGIGYCEHENGDKFNYAFNINSAATSDFAYRVSWYSNGSIESDLMNCIIGGGNKDEEFALSYRMFMPADTTVCNATASLDQVFGPNYSEGAGLISAYAEYLNEDLIFGYDVVPQAMLTNPWE